MIILSLLVFVPRARPWGIASTTTGTKGRQVITELDDRIGGV